MAHEMLGLRESRCIWRKTCESGGLDTNQGELVMSLKQRRDKNELLRARGTEPVPGDRAGVKRWMRYLSRVQVKIRVKNPDIYLNSSPAKDAARYRARHA